jgi:hypothetical protein
MKNVVKCPKCGTENPFYKLTCLNCKNYLRERVYNLDLWKLTGLLIENPAGAFRLIIHSEHKNFIIFITVLFSIKTFINSRFLSFIHSGNSLLKINMGLELLITLAASIIVIFIYSLLITIINKIGGLKTRIRDNHAILSYSLIPYLFALIVLFPIEIIIFGDYLFSNNPSPFIIKPAIAYILLGFEVLLILWGIFLTITGIYTISKNILYSILVGILFTVYLFGYFFILSKLFFT